MIDISVMDIATLQAQIETLAQENTRLRERLERHAQREIVLHRINNRIRASLTDVAMVMQTTMEELGRALEAARCWALLYRSEGLEPELFEYALADAPPRPSHNGLSAPGLLACPMMLQHEVFGFLFAHRLTKPAWSPAEMELVESVAGELAVALDNARLLAESERRAKEVEQLLAQLRTLSSKLVQAMEAERRRIARELHDEAGQLLYGLRLQVDALARNIPSDHADLRSQAEAMRELIEEARRKIRKLSHELRPATLDELGLVPALRRLMDDFGGEAGLVAVFEPSLTVRLAPQIETACYRIVQEALTNVVRHAQAKQVWVSLEAKDGHLHLKVEDDGRGFKPRQIQSKGVGLLGIQERVIGLNGEFVIHSAPGQGARLEVTFANSSA
ncbi:MAG: histidine kinase [Anaerolineales bacterium]